MREWRAIHKKLEYLPKVLIVVLLILLSACDSGGTGYSQIFTLRTVGMVLMLDGNSGFVFEGVSPFEVDVLVDVQVGAGETKAGDISSVEIDFGDGTGWEDVTTTWMSKQDLSVYTSTDAAQPHTYTEPGEYSVHCRVTFKDGDVFVEPQTNMPSYTVTVTAPTE